MEEKMFNDLVESIRQGKAIMSGEMEPGRKFVIDDIEGAHAAERIVEEVLEISQRQMVACIFDDELHSTINETRELIATKNEIKRSEKENPFR